MSSGFGGEELKYKMGFNLIFLIKLNESSDNKKLKTLAWPEATFACDDFQSEESCPFQFQQLTPKQTFTRRH